MIPDIHKTVIVTGASQGIGAGLVKAFLDRRYNVVATSRSITKTGGFKASDKLELVDGSDPTWEKLLAEYLSGNPTNRELDASARCRLWGDRRNSAT